MKNGTMRDGLSQEQILYNVDHMPMPMPGLIRSARQLSHGHLGGVCGAVANYCRLLGGGCSTQPRAWRGRLCALLSYGLACVAETRWRIAMEQAERDEWVDVVKKLMANTVELVTAAWDTARGLDGGRYVLLRGADGLTDDVECEWKDPSWMGVDAVHARHRAVLLSGVFGDRLWYEGRGWRQQTTLDTTALGGLGQDLALPASDPSHGMPRWRLSMVRDWGTKN